jgi:SAM-dependent methyltransferase
VFDQWIAGLEARHLADLSFSEVSRALRALSSTYVERRRRLSEGAALSGAGKRAAFALFYGPLHFLLVREIVRALGASRGVTRIVDLGCGTGAAGAAWADECRRTGAGADAPQVLGIDRHPWAVREAAWTYRMFALRARTIRSDIGVRELPAERGARLAAFALNELPPDSRNRVVSRLLDRRRTGGSILIVEPLAGFVAPWWDGCRRQVEAAGGRADEWRFSVDLPAIVARLDRASGLDHRTLSGKSLWLP